MQGHIRRGGSVGNGIRLYLFNDNEEEQFTSNRGGGNAAIRVYNSFGSFKGKERSAGIATGSLKGGGYRSYSKNAERNIGASLERIEARSEPARA